MIGTPVPARGRWNVRRGICAALVAALAAAGTARAQAPALPPPTSTGPAPAAVAPASSPPAAAAIFDPNLIQAGCASCGGGGGGYGGGSNPLGCNGCSGEGCDGPRCVPGRMECCEPCEACSMFGRVWCGLKGAFCCTDPCYQPCYIPAANAAFFVDSAKPVSQTRLRFDAGIGGTTPDRAEYFFARIGGRGPAANTQLNRIDFEELSLVTEFAVDRFSVFVENPYRFVRNLRAGFGDMAIGTKSMLIDSEILYFAFQFKTYIPIAPANKGLGTGHTTLEPALLATIKVLPGTYLQAELAEWIPLGGDPNASGSALKYLFSLNHVLFKPSNDLQLIGTLEFDGISFQDGLYTAPNGAQFKASTDSYFSIGPGFRLFFCQKYDIGIGMAFSVTQNNVAAELYRVEARWRF